jgi:hypothetical protein
MGWIFAGRGLLLEDVNTFVEFKLLVGLELRDFFGGLGEYYDVVVRGGQGSRSCSLR